MKKYLTIILLFVSSAVFSQTIRVLNGQYDNGKFGKPIKDTIYNLGVQTPLYKINDSTFGVLLDTTALISFGGGGANAGDTASFTTSTIYGAVFTGLSDTLTITRMMIGLKGTSPNVTVRIYWNDSLGVTAGATALTASGTAATDIYTGTSVTSFANTKIPPGNWVWCTTSVVTAKPSFMSVTLIGTKNRVR